MRTSDGYRAYVFDDDGRLVKRADLECPDDDAAKAQTRRLAGRSEAELWHGTRLVCIYRLPRTAM